MKRLNVILLGIMIIIFNSISLAKGGGNRGAGQGNKSSQGASGQGNKSGQPADKGQSNTSNQKPENGDKTRDQTRDPSTDLTGTKKRDRDRTQMPSNNRETPASAPAPN